MKLLPLAAAVLTAVCAPTGGCLLGEVADIPCTADDECATAHFCDLTVGSCRAELDGVSAPRLQITAVVVEGDDGPPGLSPFIEKTGTTALTLELKNTGGLPAVDVGVEFSRVSCVELVVDESTLPAGVVPGGSASVSMTATADGTCGSPTIIDWFLFFSGRAARGTFNFNLERTP